MRAKRGPPPLDSPRSRKVTRRRARLVQVIVRDKIRTQGRLEVLARATSVRGDQLWSS
jgi:hypothetical protein